MPKDALVAIANDLADIGQADGEVENEKKFFQAFLRIFRINI